MDIEDCVGIHRTGKCMMAAKKNTKLHYDEILSRSLAESLENIGFEDLFDLDDIERLQDEFSAATGVASLQATRFV